MNADASAAKRRKLLCLFINLAVVIMELRAFILSFGNNGFLLFQFYTEDSNLFAMVSGACLSVYIILDLYKGGVPVPMWVRLIKYMSTCCLTVTLLVVVFVLIPTMRQLSPAQLLFSGSMLFQHTLCPILAIVSFLFLEHEPPLLKKHAFYALIPTVIYAVVTTALTALRVMKGPYPFLFVYEQPAYMSVIWFVIIVGGAYLLALGLRALNSKLSRRSART